MTQMHDNFQCQQQAEDIAQALRDAFPDTLLPSATRLGCGYWMQSTDGDVEYVYQGDGLNIEAFFRGVEFWDLIGKTPAETDRLVHQFFLASPPPKRWMEVIGVPLLSWHGVTSSRFYMAPQALAYYLPAYVLTALPFLVVLPSGSFDIPNRQVSPMEFVGDTLDILFPPSDTIGWDDLARLSPEGLGPSRQPLAVNTAENFLRFIQHLSIPQKQAIQCFIAFALWTYPLYIPPVCSALQEEVARLRRFWLESMFAG